MISFIMNCWFWIRHPRSLRASLKSMKDVREVLRADGDEHSVAIFISQFKYISDGQVNWVPWIVTMFARQFTDDCDGGAILALWALKQIGAEGVYVSLLGDDGNHAIAYWGGSVFSNGKMYRVGSLSDVPSLFSNRYHTMKIRRRW